MAQARSVQIIAVEMLHSWLGFESSTHWFSLPHVVSPLPPVGLRALGWAVQQDGMQLLMGPAVGTAHGSSADSGHCVMAVVWFCFPLPLLLSFGTNENQSHPSGGGI